MSQTNIGAKHEVWLTHGQKNIIISLLVIALLITVGYYQMSKYTARKSVSAVQQGGSRNYKSISEMPNTNAKAALRIMEEKLKTGQSKKPLYLSAKADGEDERIDYGCSFGICCWGRKGYDEMGCTDQTPTSSGNGSQCYWEYSTSGVFEYCRYFN